MSDCSRWFKIKRAKSTTAIEKARLYSKHVKTLQIAVLGAGGDPDSNPGLRIAIASAHEAGMPDELIKRTIEGDASAATGYHEITYTFHGPGGVAFLVQCLTNNVSRAESVVRALISRAGEESKMDTSGSVYGMFQRKGFITVKPGPTEEQLEEYVIDAGAEDIIPQGEEGFEVHTAPNDLRAVATALEGAGLKLGEQKLIYVPQTLVPLVGEDAKKALQLMDRLDWDDNVQAVYANFDIDDALMESLSG